MWNDRATFPYCLSPRFPFPYMFYRFMFSSNQVLYEVAYVQISFSLIFTVRAGCLHTHSTHLLKCIFDLKAFPCGLVRSRPGTFAGSGPGRWTALQRRTVVVLRNSNHSYRGSCHWSVGGIESGGDIDLKISLRFANELQAAKRTYATRWLISGVFWFVIQNKC